MASNLLARLTVAGVLDRTGTRLHRRLRVAPRFLAHAEATSLQRQARGYAADPMAALSASLTSWDDFHGDAFEAAGLLLDFMETHDQLGAVRPMFPALEQFACSISPA